MNIIIYGGMASGKTMLAKLLIKKYNQEKGEVKFYEDDRPFSSHKEIDKSQRDVIERLLITKGSNNRHTIVTSQIIPNIYYEIYDISMLFDYSYNTHRLREDILVENQCGQNFIVKGNPRLYRLDNV